MSIDRYVTQREGISRDEVSVGFRTVRLFAPVELTSAQEGYQGEGWSSEWLIIADEDELGDPIFVDLAAERLPVFTASHGEDGWEPVQIADSFNGFVLALDEIAAISVGREHPVGLEQNPLPDDERERLMQRIRDANPTSDYEFWESWLES